MKALQIAATGMAAQQMRVDVTAHNIANMSTTGYDARRAEFADLHYQQLRTPGAITALTGEAPAMGEALVVRTGAKDAGAVLGWIRVD